MGRYMPLTGDFQNRDFAGILFHIFRHAMEGQLMITTPELEISLHIQDRSVQEIYSNREADRLEHYLLENGVVSHSRLTKAAAIQKQKKISLGRALQELGILNHQELWTHMLSGARQTLLPLFTLRAGRYQFVDEAEDSADIRFLNLNLLDLIRTGIDAIADGPFISDRFQNADEFQPLVSSPPPIILQPHECHVLSLIRHESRLPAITARSQLLPQQLLKTLYLLINLGMVGSRKEVGESKSQPLSLPMGAASPLFNSFDEAVQFYNQKYGYIYHVFSKEIGPVAHSILVDALTSILDQIPPFFQNCRLAEDGCLDSRSFLKTIWHLNFEENIANLLRGLEEILYAEIFAVKRHLGKEHEQLILQWIREIGH